MNISQMLDLPKAERSRYLAAMPLTRCYVWGCLDYCHIKFIRRAIVRNGGTWRELYAPPGLAVTATFKSYRGMMAATRQLVHWHNKDIRHVEAGLSEEQLAPLLHNDDFGAERPDVPALKFEIVNCITRETRVQTPSHPIRG